MAEILNMGTPWHSGEKEIKKCNDDNDKDDKNDKVWKSIIALHILNVGRETDRRDHMALRSDAQHSPV